VEFRHTKNTPSTCVDARSSVLSSSQRKNQRKEKRKKKRIKKNKKRKKKNKRKSLKKQRTRRQKRNKRHHKVMKLISLLVSMMPISNIVARSFGNACLTTSRSCSTLRLTSWSMSHSQRLEKRWTN